VLQHPVTQDGHAPAFGHSRLTRAFSLGETLTVRDIRCLFFFSVSILA
jgi:hypothetical protein